MPKKLQMKSFQRATITETLMDMTLQATSEIKDIADPAIPFHLLKSWKPDLS